MTDEVKAAGAPESKDTKAPEKSEEVLLENPRIAIEKAVIAENESVPDREDDSEAPEKEVEGEVAPKKENEKEAAEPEAPLSEVDRIKLAVQKRINKVVAEKKTAEERLAEAEAELSRLRQNPKKPDEATAPSKELTVEQVEAWLVAESEKGTLTKADELKAMRLIIDLEKKAAVKSFQEEQRKEKEEADAKYKRESSALVELAKDYIVFDSKGEPDMKADMTLANQNGKLFKAAIALYNDAELRSTIYNDSDRSLAFRRAVQDANRELHAKGLVKAPKVEAVEAPRRTPREALADPDATDSEEVSTPSNSSNLSDAEKVRDEIKARQRMRNSRRAG